MPRLKMIFIVLLILSNNIYSHGQNFKAQIIGGLNLAQVDGDSYGGYNQPGLFAGITVYRGNNKQKNTLLKEKRNYGFGIIYSQKGSHKKTSEESPDIFKLRYNYICLPLFIDFHELGKGMENITIRAGLSPNITIASKRNFGYGWEENKIRPYEVSGILGVYYQFNKQFSGLVQLENSLLSVGDPVITSIYYNQNSSGLYNRMITFGFTYNLKP